MSQDLISQHLCYQKGNSDTSECYIDATFANGRGGGLEIGNSKCGKGVKIMATVDRAGLPLSVSTHAANHHEVKLVQLSFDFYMIEAMPDVLIGDRAYDSDDLDDDMRDKGIKMVSPHRKNRVKPKTQDGASYAATSADGSSSDSLRG